MMKRVLVFMVAFAIVLSGCSKLGEVEIKEAYLKSVDLISTTSANIEIEYVVHNPSTRELTLDDLNGFIVKSGVNFAQITMLEASPIAPKRVSVNSVTFKLDILDPLTLLSMGLNISKWQMSDFYLDARAVINTGVRKRSVRIKEIPIHELIDRL